MADPLFEIFVRSVTDPSFRYEDAGGPFKQLMDKYSPGWRANLPGLPEETPPLKAEPLSRPGGKPLESAPWTQKAFSPATRAGFNRNMLRPAWENLASKGSKAFRLMGLAAMASGATPTEQDYLYEGENPFVRHGMGYLTTWDPVQWADSARKFFRPGMVNDNAGLHIEQDLGDEFLKGWFNAPGEHYANMRQDDEWGPRGQDFFRHGYRLKDVISDPYWRKHLNKAFKERLHKLNEYVNSLPEAEDRKRIYSSHVGRLTRSLKALGFTMPEIVKLYQDISGGTFRGDYKQTPESLAPVTRADQEWGNSKGNVLPEKIPIAMSQFYDRVYDSLYKKQEGVPDIDFTPELPGGYTPPSLGGATHGFQ